MNESNINFDDILADKKRTLKEDLVQSIGNLLSMYHAERLYLPIDKVEFSAYSAVYDAIYYRPERGAPGTPYFRVDKEGNLVDPTNLESIRKDHPDAVVQLKTKIHQDDIVLIKKHSGLSRRDCDKRFVFPDASIIIPENWEARVKDITKRYEGNPEDYENRMYHLELARDVAKHGILSLSKLLNKFRFGARIPGTMKYKFWAVNGDGELVEVSEPLKFRHRLGLTEFIFDIVEPTEEEIRTALDNDALDRLLSADGKPVN